MFGINMSYRVGVLKGGDSCDKREEGSMEREA